MADLENTATNTAGEAGSNANVTLSAEEAANLVWKIANERFPKVEKSIAKSNFEKLSPDEQERAYAALEELKNQDARKQKEAFEKVQKELEKANKRIAEFENQAKSNKINAEFASLLAKSGVSNQKSIDYISKMAGDLNQFYKEDGSIDSEGINSIISSILTDIPSLKDERKTIYYEQPQANKTAESLEDAELDAAFGLIK